MSNNGIKRTNGMLRNNRCRVNDEVNFIFTCVGNGRNSVDEITEKRVNKRSKIEECSLKHD